MPNHQGVWSLSEQYQNASGWPVPPLPLTNRGIYAGGLASYSADIQVIHIPSLGNSRDFGDLFLGVSNQPSAASSSTRYLYAGGFDGDSHTNTIQFGNFNGGTGSDFGDLTVTRTEGAGLSNETRAVFAKGTTMDYVTIASTGNATSFGNLGTSQESLRAVASTTRGVTMGGANSNQNMYITISSTGNSTDFGDMLVGATSQGGACSNATRGIYAGGYDSVEITTTIQYLTIASTGNTVDFGDLLSADRFNDGVSSSTRAVFLGFAGNDQSEYVTIASTGNAAEFGDLAGNRVQVGAGTSNAHGGLS